MRIPLLVSSLVFFASCGTPPGPSRAQEVPVEEPGANPGEMDSHLQALGVDAGLASQPTATAREYVACGCGCCGGAVPDPNKAQCVGSDEELDKVIASDQEARKAAHCARVGCSLGTLYRVCEGAPNSGLAPQ